MKYDTYGIRHNPKTGRPWAWGTWGPEQRRLYLRSRAQKAGLDVNALEKLIRETIEAIGPDLRRFIKIDLPAKIDAAIRELRTRRVRPRAGRYTYDRNGNVMSIE